MADQENVPQQPAAAKPTLGLKRRGFTAPAFVGAPAAKRPALGAAKPALPAAAKPVAPRPPAAAAGAPTAAPAAQPGEALYFTVLYCKYQPNKKLRKNKSFADGIMEVALDTKKATLMDAEGKTVSSTVLRGVNAAALGAGSNVVVGNWEVEVEEPLEADKFKSGTAFMQPAAAAPAALAAAPAAPAGFKPPGGGFKRPGGLGGGGGLTKPGGLGGGKAEGAAGTAGEPPRAHALHDPAAEGAVLLNAAQYAGGKGLLAPGRPVSPVVVDPYIGRHLRPHQVEGVKFLYEATQGLRAAGMHGCILADEMGLGKTLQVLALLWTLLKQGPEGRPSVRKAMVVTPSSLCQNWADEARKWLGTERMRVMVLGPGPEGKQQVTDFKHGSVHRVVVVSYETLRKHAADLAGCIDLLVCDEGHRLKSAQGNKTISALASLNCRRRVLLTGTPIQNDLTEFFAMVNFVCPDALGSLATFERIFAAPINRSRDRNASDKEKELGATRSAELARRVEQFVLRRTREVNARYLPPLTNYVVFCRPTEEQLRVYSGVLGSSTVRRMLAPSGSDFGDQALSVLTSLRKICNHPVLYTPAPGGAEAAAADNEEDSSAGEVAEFDPDQSGKMAVLGVLLCEALEVAGDRCVVVSQSTAALDLVQKLCGARGWSTVRIDGSTDVNKRQDVVNSFNHYNVGQVFLLSTTAGGAGLNLTGANRLVLLDSHWNPAMDLQAMARVWRDGQRKPCFVYRLLTAGTVDEKMYQRQLKKNDIAASMMGGAAGGGGAKGAKQAGGKFSKEELAQLFTLRVDTRCDTAQILREAAGKARAAAAAAGGGATAAARLKQQRQRRQQLVDDEEEEEEGGAAGGKADEDPVVAAAAAAAAEFKDVSDSCVDAPLKAAIASGHVTFVHLDKSQTAAAAAPAADKAAAEQQGQQQEQQQQQAQQAVPKERSEGGVVAGAAAAAAAVAGAAAGADGTGALFGMGIDELELEDDE
ncbi:hypothetical protein ABPG75_000447 [Micractinium tetrahymenae]